MSERTEKACGQCRKLKPITEYKIRKDRSAKGKIQYTSYCKSCARKASMKYRNQAYLNGKEEFRIDGNYFDSIYM